MSVEFTESARGPFSEKGLSFVAAKLDELSQRAPEDLTQDDIMDGIAGVAFIPESRLAPLDERLDRTDGCSVSVSYTFGMINGKKVEITRITEDGIEQVTREFLRGDSNITFSRTGTGPISELKKPFSPDEAQRIVGLLKAQL